MNIDENHCLLTGTFFRRGTFRFQYKTNASLLQEKDVDKFRTFITAKIIA